MNCHPVRLHISALVDQSLDPELSAEIQQHLPSCPACTGFYREQLELTRWLQTESMELEPSPKVWLRVQSRLDLETSAGSFDSGRLLQLFAVPYFRYATAGLVILLWCSLALIYLGRSGNENQQLLARLESFSLSVEENPFLPQFDRQNPFHLADGKTDGDASGTGKQK